MDTKESRQLRVLCALLFEKRTRHFSQPGNNQTEGHDGPRRQADNLRVPLRPSVR